MFFHESLNVGCKEKRDESASSPLWRGVEIPEVRDRLLTLLVAWESATDGNDHVLERPRSHGVMGQVNSDCEYGK